MLDQWEKMNLFVWEESGGQIESVYEVGCGSGVNLFLYQKLRQIKNLGGMDYSSNLIELAKETLKIDDLSCEEAKCLAVEPQYDLVLSDSVFQYFESSAYGMEVLEKMYQKAKTAVVVTEIHDSGRKEEHLNYRRKQVEDYDEKYRGLEKTYYAR